MSTDKKVKVYKNPGRNQPETRKSYVPQYQLMGVEPSEYKSPLAPGYQVPVASTPQKNNPRSPRAMIRQPYAEAVQSPIGRGRGLLPNVGNNMEQTWSSVDDEVVDDISGITVESQRQMVDNNEFVSAAALGLPEETATEDGPTEEDVNSFYEQVIAHEEPPKSFLTQDQLQSALAGDQVSEVIKQLEEEEYLLLVSGEPICSGSKENVQEQTRALIFGEHELYGGNPVSVDDIIVIKRTKIKVGVFLE